MNVCKGKSAYLYFLPFGTDKIFIATCSSITVLTPFSGNFGFANKTEKVGVLFIMAI